MVQFASSSFFWHDVFLEFVQDEDHSILMSSHITTDLEKVADYITFIHQGKVVFSKRKDELRYHYGIIDVVQQFSIRLIKKKSLPTVKMIISGMCLLLKRKKLKENIKMQ